ncbi:hypothetical protein QQS21_004430 [Conoideocrella luteorostrata]|uniref:Uncharacterized protein n=1 Tax=Conoideocrella luteorostrata TaxID=1105319 RepID=A0AAJ0CUD6_9HYPO|nr:hypothetical protein QQS21_004430 [Conoideocrella luteorostrata]
MALLRSTRITISSLLNPEPTTPSLPSSAGSGSFQSPGPIGALVETPSSATILNGRLSPSSSDDEEEPEPQASSQRVRCPRCLKSISKGSIADHRKTHYLNGGSQGVATSRKNGCYRCRRGGHRCIVAKTPRHKALKTLRCLECLANKECCSFAEVYKHLDINTLSEHPAAQQVMPTPLLGL